MSEILSDAGLDILFRTARTHNTWQPKPVSDTLLRAIYDLARMGPTSANASPARFVFVKSKAGKEKLSPALSEGNRAKTLAAPVTVIVGHDLKFYDLLPKLFPQNLTASTWFSGNEQHAAMTALRNGSLQGAYLILAARALGLDAGPMSGFNNDLVDKAFFPDGRIKSNFLVNLGYGEAKDLFPRNPRLDFEEAAQIV